jgi:hypothetical protein
MTTKKLNCNPQLLRLAVLLLIGVPLLFGCAVAVPVGLTMGAGTVYLNKERAPIRVTENEGEVANCTFIKHVEADSYWGGLLFQDKALAKTISDLTHDSIEAGANVLVVKSKSKSFEGSSSTGDAYRCPSTENPSTSSKVPAGDPAKSQ